MNKLLQWNDAKKAEELAAGETNFFLRFSSTFSATLPPELRAGKKQGLEDAHAPGLGGQNSGNR